MSERGLRRLPLESNGGLVDIRFRAHEIALLEDECDMGIVAILSPKMLGISVLRKALRIGAGAGYAAKNKKKRLTEATVTEWINSWQKPFDELLVPVFECVAEGLPGVDLEEEEDGDEPPLGETVE